MKASLGLVLVLGAACQTAWAQKVPTFERYPAKVQTLKVHPAISETNLVKTALDDAAAKGVNFGGHFVIATWRIRRGPVSGGIMDAKTGRVFAPRELAKQPVGIECVHDVKNLMSFRASSTLLIFNGAVPHPKRPDGPEVCRTYYYQWTGRRLVLLKEAPYSEPEE